MRAVLRITNSEMWNWDKPSNEVLWANIGRSHYETTGQLALVDRTLAPVPVRTKKQWLLGPKIAFKLSSASAVMLSLP